MTKILIFSDSHADVETMCIIADIEKPDAIIHLGDHVADAQQLSEKYPDIPLFNVLGNTDAQNENEEWIKYIEIAGKRIMLTHGHIFLNDSTKFEDLTNIFLGDARSDNADIILFGHTHAPFVNYRNGKWVMNPGRIGRFSKQVIHATYGVLMIESGNIQWIIREIDK